MTNKYNNDVWTKKENKSTTTDKSYYGNPQTVDDVPNVKIYGTDFRKAILNMHTAVTELDLWDKMKEDPGKTGYMFGNKPYINKLSNHHLVKESGHSGATQACCMRYMQYNANNGWDNFHESFNKQTTD